MNQTFKNYISKFIVVHFDDFFIFTGTTEQHLQHLLQVFSVLRDQRLFANREKGSFLVEEVTFLGYIISGDGLKMDVTKVDAILS
jgi:hypothetical protein